MYAAVTLIEKEELTTHILNRTNYIIKVSAINGRNEPTQIVESGQQLPYAQFFAKTNDQQLKFLVQDLSEESQLSGEFVSSFVVDTRSVNGVDATYFDTKFKDQLMQVRVSFIGKNKVIEVCLVKQKDIHKKENRINESIEVCLRIVNIGVSFMRLSKDKPREEILNVSAFGSLISLSIDSLSQVSFRGKLDDIQIDNSRSPNTYYPVVLKRSEEKLRDGETIKPALNWIFSIEQSGKSEHMYFKEALVFVSKFDVYVEEDYAAKVQDYFSEISSKINDELENKSEKHLKLKYFESLLKIPENIDINKRSWEIKKIDTSNNQVYAEKLTLPVFSFSLSYYQDPSITMEKDFELSSLIGVAIGGFEDAKILIKGQQLT